MNLLALDPGTFQTGWAHLINGRVVAFGIDANDAVLRRVLAHCAPMAHVVCEQVRSYGMAVGAEVFETVRWCGRFEQAFVQSWTADHANWHYVPRAEVKLALCHSPRANDSNIRAAVLDLYGGEKAAKGNKAAPGPLYGAKGDVYAAIAVGHAWLTKIAQRAA